MVLYSRRNDVRSFVGELWYSRRNDVRSFIGELNHLQLFLEHLRNSFVVSSGIIHYPSMINHLRIIRLASRDINQTRLLRMQIL